MILKSDTAYFWDWAIAGIALWALIGLVWHFTTKRHRKSMWRFVCVAALISILLPTQFPSLWRLDWGPAPISNEHAIELTQQVAIGQLLAIALLLFMLGQTLIDLTARAVSATLDKPYFRYVRRLSAYWTGGDVVE